MSVGQPTLYMAWATALKAKERTDTPKAVTASYVAGPAFKIGEGQLVQLLAECVTKNSTSTLYFTLELSHSGEDDWFPLCASDALAVSGGEIQGHLYPLVYKFTAADDIQRAFNVIAQANFARLLVKGDVAGAEVRVRAMV